MSGEKKVGQDQGEQGRQREAASASGLRMDVHLCICTLTITHTHTRTHILAPVHSFLGLPLQKQIPAPRQSRSISIVRMEEGG